MMKREFRVVRKIDLNTIGSSSRNLMYLLKCSRIELKRCSPMLHIDHLESQDLWK
jgi:hypothetical protein